MRPTHLILSMLFLAACGDDESTTRDGVADSSGDAGDTREVDPTDAADDVEAGDDVEDAADGADTVADGADTADTAEPVDTTETSETDVPTDVDERGFAIRVPRMHDDIPAEDFDGTIRVESRPEIDHVCKLERDGVETFLYVQADPVRCRSFGGCEYDVVGAFTTIGDALNVPLAGVGYDYGGNHHNDFITLPSAEGPLKIYHSSFGFGFRACHPPDCVQVLGAEPFTFLDDGCTTDRTRPAPCVLIAMDGSEPPIPDTFEKCNGDPNVNVPE